MSKERFTITVTGVVTDRERYSQATIAYWVLAGAPTYVGVRESEVETSFEPVYDEWPFRDPEKYWNQTGFWVSKDGTPTQIASMDDSHLANTVRLIAREGPERMGTPLGVALATELTFRV